MARIENQTAYPLKANPVSTDYFIITDSQDSNRTKNVQISALQSAIGATIYTASNVIPEARTVGFNNTLNFTGSQATSEFFAQHTNGHIFRVNQTGVYSTTLGVGITTQQASAILQADSTTRGFLPPRMTTVQRDAIVSTATGLTIYNTTTNVLETYNGTTWNANSNQNLYNTDGTLSSTRVVTGQSGNELEFSIYNLLSTNWTTRSLLDLDNDRVLLGYQTGNGSGVINTQKQIVITPTNMLVTDTETMKGLEYAADYSSNYTDRSLVDRGYVLAQLAADPTIYTADGTITDANRTVTLSDTNDSGELLRLTAVGTANKASRFALSFQSAAMVLTTDGTLLKSIAFSPTQMLVSDTVNSKGLEYAADYSANYTDRSLVDRAFVIAQGGTSIYTADGNITSTARTVTGLTNSTLTFNMHNTTASTWNTRGRIALTSTSSLIAYQTGNGAGVVTGTQQIDMNGTAMTVTDSITNRGLQYANDYSGNYTDRSLVDRAYVLAQTPTTLYTGNGTLDNVPRIVNGINNASLSFGAYDTGPT